MKTKGFIFTIDAVFSLIVATAAVGILIYAHFTEPASFQATTSEAFSVAQTLMQTKLASIASQYAAAAANSSAAYAAWPYFAGGGALQATSPSGPMLPLLLFQFNAAAPISTPVSVDSGMAVFGAGNTIYLVNASTGNQILSKAIQGNVLYPIVYRRYVIYANSTDYLTAMRRNGSVIWRSSSLAAAASTPLTLANNYVALGAGSSVIVASPSNGSIISTLTLAQQASTPAYGSGELFASTSAIGAQNYLYAFSFSGAGMAQIWKKPLTTAFTTSPSVSGNIILVGSGDQIVAMTPGGGTVWTVSPSSNVTGAASISGGNAYYTLGSSITAINFSCGCAAQAFQITHTANVVASTTQTQLYTVEGFTNFVSYSTAGGYQKLWNVTLPASTNLAFQDVPLAYGNAYLTGANTLYAFGTCRAPGSQSILQSIGTMYLSGSGGCAAQILNSSYRSGNLGIFINGSYAPSLKSSGFNGASSYITVPDSSSIDIGGTLTIIAWVYINAYNSSGTMCVVCKWGFTSSADQYWLGINGYGKVLGELGQGTGSATGNTVLSVPTGSWHQIGLEYSSNTESAILDGQIIQIASGLSGSTVPASPPALGIGADVGNGAPTHLFNGHIAGAQVYGGALNGSQVESLYLGGIAAAPVQNTGLVYLGGWWPLEGDANDYSGFGNVGYPSNIIYSNRPFDPISLINSYEVSAASFPLSLGNDDALYNVSVVIWR